MPTKECPLCGGNMQLRQVDTVVRVPQARRQHESRDEALVRHSEATQQDHGSSEGNSDEDPRGTAANASSHAPPEIRRQRRWERYRQLRTLS